MTLNARFNLKCALRTARLTYVCCGFRSCIVKARNGFPMTQRQMILKEECGYRVYMLVNFIGHVFRTLALNARFNLIIVPFLTFLS